MKCERCGEERIGSICSMFNTQTVCFPCKELEEAHPEYEAARKAEQRAVQRGDYNFPGVGLPADFESQS